MSKPWFFSKKSDKKPLIGNGSDDENQGVYEGDLISRDDDDSHGATSGASSTDLTEPELVEPSSSPLDGITPEEQLKFLSKRGYGNTRFSTATKGEMTSGDSVEHYDVPRLAKDTQGNLSSEYQDPELAKCPQKPDPNISKPEVADKKKGSPILMNN